MMSTRPEFSLHIRAEIETARSEIFKSSERFNLLFLPVINFSNIGSFFNNGTTAPSQRMPANLILQIRDFTSSLFDAEAKHFWRYTSDSSVLQLWLNELAGEIRTQAKKLVADSRHDFHCSAEERSEEIENELIERIKHWLSNPSLGRLQTPDAPLNPVGNRSVMIRKGLYRGVLFT